MIYPESAEKCARASFIDWIRILPALILIAKNDAAHAALSEQFKQRTMEKHYRAVALWFFFPRMKD